MKKFASFAMAFLALLAFTGGSVFAQSQTITIAMTEENNSGQSGTATLTLSDDGSSITVEVNIASDGTGEPQPAHIHAGSCANLDPKPAYPLNNLVDGHSTTVITDMSATGMGTSDAGSYAINVHKSKAEADVYVSCGDIVAENVVGMPKTGGSDNMTPMLAFAALALVATGTTLRFARRKI